MQRAFCFPIVRTLHTFLSGFGITVAFDCDYMLVLCKRVESMNEHEKFVVVVTFDGMALHSSPKYLEHGDRIVGFEDMHSFKGSSADAAKQALQFMVRGISTRWKEPVSHLFSGSSVNADVLKAMILLPFVADVYRVFYVRLSVYVLTILTILTILLSLLIYLVSFNCLLS